jgi:hypothetical protein
MAKVKIISIKLYGYIDTVILEKNRYREQRMVLEQELGEEMPDLYDIPFNNKQSWRMLSKPLKVVITTDKEVLEFHLSPGMITDFASIPRILRGQRSLKTLFVRIPDNDDPRILWPSLIHDAGCSFKLFGSSREGFQYNNDLFYATCKYFGLSRAQCRLLWAGVSSPIGWNLYKSGRGYEDYVRANLIRTSKDK